MDISNKSLRTSASCNKGLTVFLRMQPILATRSTFIKESSPSPIPNTGPDLLALPFHHQTKQITQTFPRFSLLFLHQSQTVHI